MATIQMISQVVLWERRLEIERNNRNIVRQEPSALSLPRLKFLRYSQKDSDGRSSANSGIDISGSSCRCHEEWQKQYLN